MCTDQDLNQQTKNHMIAARKHSGAPQIHLDQKGVSSLPPQHTKINWNASDNMSKDISTKNGAENDDLTFRGTHCGYHRVNQLSSDINSQRSPSTQHPKKLRSESPKHNVSQQPNCKNQSRDSKTNNRSQRPKRRNRHDLRHQTPHLPYTMWLVPRSPEYVQGSTGIKGPNAIRTTASI